MSDLSIRADEAFTVSADILPPIVTRSSLGLVAIPICPDLSMTNTSLLETFVNEIIFPSPYCFTANAVVGVSLIISRFSLLYTAVSIIVDVPCTCKFCTVNVLFICSSLSNLYLLPLPFCNKNFLLVPSAMSSAVNEDNLPETAVFKLLLMLYVEKNADLILSFNGVVYM